MELGLRERGSKGRPAVADVEEHEQRVGWQCLKVFFFIHLRPVFFQHHVDFLIDSIIQFSFACNEEKGVDEAAILCSLSESEMLKLCQA